MLFDVVLERGASVATPFRDPGHLTVNRVLSSGDSLGHLRFTQPLEGQNAMPIYGRDRQIS